MNEDFNEHCGNLLYWREYGEDNYDCDIGQCDDNGCPKDCTHFKKLKED
jgi:hypothetical protein